MLPGYLHLPLPGAHTDPAGILLGSQEKSGGYRTFWSPGFRVGGGQVVSAKPGHFHWSMVLGEQWQCRVFQINTLY